MLDVVDYQQCDLTTCSMSSSNGIMNHCHPDTHVSQDTRLPILESRSDCNSIAGALHRRPFPPSTTAILTTTTAAAAAAATTTIRSASQRDRLGLNLYLQVLMIPSLLFQLLFRWQQQYSLSTDMIIGKAKHIGTTPRRQQRRIDMNSRPSHMSSPSRSTRLLSLLVLLYSCISFSTTRILSSFTLSSSVFVQAQDSNSASDLCALTIWVYSDDQICKSLNPPTGVGTIIADNTCRTTEIDTSQTPNQDDYTLFPGTYRAQCTADGQSVHFIESGCKYSNCSSGTIGSDVCQRDITLHSSLYSRRSIPEYKVQRIQDVTSASLFSCYALSDGYQLNLNFIIFGDCNSSACNRLATLSPTPPPAPTSPDSFESLPPETSPVDGATAAPSYAEKTTSPVSSGARNDTVKVVYKRVFIACCIILSVDLLNY